MHHYIKNFIFIFTWVCLSTIAFAAVKQQSVSMQEAYSGAQLFAQYPKPNYGTGEQRKLIERGEYLSKVGDCISCHTNTPEGGKAYAGGLPIRTPFGVMYSPNITPDPETGIGKWTDEQFIRAMHDGIRPDGKHYLPVFPYVFFNKITKPDLIALKAYLFSIPAVKQENKKMEIPFPFNWRFLQFGWKVLFFYPYSGEYQYDPKKSPEWNRGAYLVEGLGHCAMCHSPLNILGSPKRSKYLTGGFIDGFWAPNITELGLQGTTTEEVMDVFRKGELIRGAGKVVGPMAEVNHNSLRYLTDYDLRSIVIYLSSVRHSGPNFGKLIENEDEEKVGRKVFYNRCAICHGEGREIMGAPVIGDSENWMQRYKKGMEVLYTHTINGYNNMPLKGNCVTCTDSEIRSAVNYLIDHSLSFDQKRLAFMKPAPTPTIEYGKTIYEKNCASCHATGKNGAPIVGDKKAWEPRIAKGMGVLFSHSINGINNEHIMGGCKTCSNTDVIAAVKYMVQESKTKGDYSLW